MKPPPASTEELLKRGYVEGHYDVDELEAALHSALRGQPIDGDVLPRVARWLLEHTPTGWATALQPSAFGTL